MINKDRIPNLKRERIKRYLHEKLGKYTMRLSQFSSGNKCLCNSCCYKAPGSLQRNLIYKANKDKHTSNKRGCIKCHKETEAPHCYDLSEENKPCLTQTAQQRRGKWIGNFHLNMQHVRCILKFSKRRWKKIFQSEIPDRNKNVKSLF